MKTIIGILLAIALCGCTYSISLVHTEGTASDVIDTDQKPTADVSPNITGLPGLPL